jgi:hypothetical protein
VKRSKKQTSQARRRDSAGRWSTALQVSCQGSQATVWGFVQGIEALERRYALHAIIAHSFGGPALGLTLQRGLAAKPCRYCFSDRK